MARIRSKTVRQSKLMKQFSTLAGPVQNRPYSRKHTVSFTDIASYDKLVYRVWTRVAAYGALLFTLSLAFILFKPSRWIIVQQPESALYGASLVMLICLGLLQIFAIIGTYSSTRSTLKAKNPVPVRPPGKLRVAFATTRAPGEPISMAEKTLKAAKQVKYAKGTVDVWLLDETNNQKMQNICKELGVKYFSRAGISEWNTVKPKRKGLTQIIALTRRTLTRGNRHVAPAQKSNPFFAAKTKHGNFNAWLAHLASENIAYDILAGVDTDQVPESNYLERMLGYFHDKDVAYVVGPQVYGNYKPGLKGLVARWAESQASFFQSTIQRAGNASTSPMFVGTNYAVRVPVLRQIGGFQPCITEDMATGLAIHAKRNPTTGKRWKSIYTPDVLAIGEGPDFWSTYFTQQWRWAAGTFDTWQRVVWRMFFRLSPGAMLHYFLMLTYYPMTALTWLLGMVSSMTYLVTGATAILAPWSMFLSLYMMTVVMQMSLYFWNRRFNVSPHEPEGSFGIPGMVISTLSAPIYLSALMGIALGKKPHFVVTIKGGSKNPDWFPAFRTHLQWAAVLVAGLAYGLIHRHNHPAMLVWAAMQLVICLTPFALGMALAVPERLHKKVNTLTKPFIKSEESPHA